MRIGWESLVGTILNQRTNPNGPRGIQQIQSHKGMNQGQAISYQDLHVTKKYQAKGFICPNFYARITASGAHVV